MIHRVRAAAHEAAPAAPGNREQARRNTRMILGDG
jgi:hypothetical protein